MNLSPRYPYTTRQTRNGQWLLVYEGGRKLAYEPRTQAERAWAARVRKALLRVVSGGRR